MADESNSSSNNVVGGGDSPAGNNSPVSPAAAAVPPPPPPAPEADVNVTNVSKRPRMEVGESSGTAAEPPSPPPPPPPAAVAAAAVPEQPQLEHPCLLCDKRFGSRYALFGHMRTHRDRTWRGAFPPPVFTREEFADVLPLLAGGGWAEVAVPPAGAEALPALAAPQAQGGADEGEEEGNNRVEIDLNEPPAYRVPDLNFPPSPPPPPAAN